jgi:D-tyrosyl-tRNA(Tyr) deacylase
MQLLLQRVSYARVEVAGDSAGEIDRGLLVFAGLEQTDTQETCDKAAARLINYRVFQDSDGKMNASLQQVAVLFCLSLNLPWLPIRAKA